MSIKINNDNYDTYKKVFVIICRHQWELLKGLLPEDVNPVLMLESVELKNKSLAKKALQSGINDIISDVKEYPKETLVNIDLELKSENLPDLKLLLSITKKTINKVLKAKKIMDIDNYYFIKEILDDTTSEISEEERASLSKYLGDFEIKSTSR